MKEIPAELLSTGEYPLEQPTEKLPENPYFQAKKAFHAKPFAQSYSSFGQKPRQQFGTENGKKLSYEVGDRVHHIKFGDGTVTDITAGGRDFEVTVDFDRAGTKKMFAAFAKLKKL